MTRSVCFSITGEFVTETSRSWLYEEKRPYEKVIGFLLSCMCGTDFDNSTLKKLANDVLLGKKKFEGTTKDGSFGMVDDDTDIIKKYPFSFENKPEPKIVFNDEEDEKPVDAVMRNIKAYGKRIRKKQNKTVKVLSTGDYGWLRRDGKFFEAEWGSHDSWATSYIEKHYPNISTAPFDEGYYPGDFLVKRGWLLLHNTSQCLVRVSDFDLQSATKRQKEFLYDYFLERDMESDAVAVWAEPK